MEKEKEKEKEKRSVPLLISWIICLIYLLGIAFLFTFAASHAVIDEAYMEFQLVADITALLFVIHGLLVISALIFNIVGWAANIRWAALVGAILYAVSILFALLFPVFSIILAVLSFVGFAVMSKQVNKQENPYVVLNRDNKN